MKHNHSFLRFILDTLLVILLILMLISPVFFIFSLKISNLNLQAKAIEAVAGSQSQK